MTAARGAISAPGPLRPGQDVSGFSCGKSALDDWLKHRATAAEGRSARTYSVCAGSAVVGYYCLVAGAVLRVELPRKLRRNTPELTPVILIGRLAVDQSCRGMGIGGALLQDAFLRALTASEIIGARAVMVHAIDENAGAFYEHFGFERFAQTTNTYFLPLETIRLAR
jgi:GNAT superfamily N-acetyltransferase